METSKTEPYKGYEIEAHIVPGGVTARIMAMDDFSRAVDRMSGSQDGQMLTLSAAAPKSDWDADHLLNTAIKAASEELERRFSKCDRPFTGQ